MSRLSSLIFFNSFIKEIVLHKKQSHVLISSKKFQYKHFRQYDASNNVYKYASHYKHKKNHQRLHDSSCLKVSIKNIEVLCKMFLIKVLTYFTKMAIIQHRTCKTRFLARANRKVYCLVTLTVCLIIHFFELVRETSNKNFLFIPITKSAHIVINV